MGHGSWVMGHGSWVMGHGSSDICYMDEAVVWACNSARVRWLACTVNA